MKGNIEENEAIKSHLIEFLGNSHTPNQTKVHKTVEFGHSTFC